MFIMKGEGEPRGQTLKPLKDSSVTHYRLPVVAVIENPAFLSQIASM